MGSSAAGLPHMQHPQLPVTLPQSQVELVLYGPDAVEPAPPKRGLKRLWFWRTTPPQPKVKRVGWAIDIPPDLDNGKLGNFRREWANLNPSLADTDELNFESPSLLSRGIGLSSAAHQTFQRIVDHRRSITSDQEALCLPSIKQADAEESGYTLVHVATAIMASFYVDHTGFGRVLAKSYGNQFISTELGDHLPEHFCGYGVGRRLYLAANALWPNVRWRDAASRTTSEALRQWLHQMNPYVWQDKKCSTCISSGIVWRKAYSGQINRVHSLKDQASG